MPGRKDNDGSFLHCRYFQLYGNGHFKSAPLLEGIRDQVYIATKTMAQNGEDFRKDLETSLKNLRTDHIDLYYQHRLDPRVPVEVVAETVADLIREGKVRAWGLSMVGEDALRRAHAVCPVSAVQNLYNHTDTHDEALFPVVEELGITYVSACPLSKGLLSGAYSAASTFEAEDFRSHMPQFTEEGFRTYAPLIQAVEEVARAQVSLAYMMDKDARVVPIPGSRKEERIRENAGAADIGLTAEDLARLDVAAASI